MKMGKVSQVKKTAMMFLFVCFYVLTLPSASSAGVTFKDGDYVHIGNVAPVPLIWKVKDLTNIPGDKQFFIGPVIDAGVFHSTDDNDWFNSDIKSYLNGDFLSDNFYADELATKVLTPYGNMPVFPPTRGSNPTPPAKDTVGAGDVLVWLPSVQELMVIYDKSDNMLTWPNANPTRTEFAQDRVGRAEGDVPYWTRTVAVDLDDPTLNDKELWILWSAGFFGIANASNQVLDVLTRPVVSADETVMLYKNGSGTEYNPYEVFYPWDIDSDDISYVAPVTASAGGYSITLRFPETITKDNVWPTDAWSITDEKGNGYIVVGSMSKDDLLTLTLYPPLPPNTNMTLTYAQGYNDERQGLNTSKGAILKASAPYFALPKLTMGIKTREADSGAGTGDGPTSGDIIINIPDNNISVDITLPPISIDIPDNNISVDITMPPITIDVPDNYISFDVVTPPITVTVPDNNTPIYNVPDYDVPDNYISIDITIPPASTVITSPDIYYIDSNSSSGCDSGFGVLSLLLICLLLLFS